MNAIALYNEIQTTLHQGKRVVVATVVKTTGAAPCEIGSKMLIAQDGTPQGSIAGPITDKQIAQESLKALREDRSHLAHIHIDADNGEAVGSCGATLEVFFEVLRPEPRLIIVGAGYVAQSLARLAATLGFRIVVVDDRRDLADPQVFSDKVQLVFGDIPTTIRKLEPDESSWLVIVTRGHTLDNDALRAALQTRAAYIGMIGSTSKVKQIFRHLREEGISRAQLEQVHAPIGLDLGAETPDEIALSIAAEMVMLRRQGSGLPLKSRHQLLDDQVLQV
ncbi:XdhC family protein [Ktedonospora formicarum]|uniref:Sulfurylase large subunit, molybdopterin cytosine dinucleotide biosynthesis n=1 Tax=Ktedonospora formicarum TaxID=2778364 RepID=A0A8J3I025_9CHLR|nr:XdhC/CoxI family protein [Ktedonospora formicarum]GHO44310.1 sulfurylase large subunit, molybdopterin cytosine dinucleotide biosynthesis [Ktedonospora formicarum]